MSLVLCCMYKNLWVVLCCIIRSMSLVLCCMYKNPWVVLCCIIRSMSLVLCCMYKNPWVVLCCTYKNLWVVLCCMYKNLWVVLCCTYKNISVWLVTSRNEVTWIISASSHHKSWWGDVSLITITQGELLCVLWNLLSGSLEVKLVTSFVPNLQGCGVWWWWRLGWQSNVEFSCSKPSSRHVQFISIISIIMNVTKTDMPWYDHCAAVKLQSFHSRSHCPDSGLSLYVGACDLWNTCFSGDLLWLFDVWNEPWSCRCAEQQLQTYNILENPFIFCVCCQHIPY